MSDNNSDSGNVMIYTLTLIFNESFIDENGQDINVPTFLPFSYSSEEAALYNAQLAEEVYGEDLASWGVTKVGIDKEITAKHAGETLH